MQSHLDVRHAYAITRNLFSLWALKNLLNAVPDREILHRRDPWLQKLKLLFEFDPPASRRKLNAVMEDCGVGLSLQCPASISFQPLWPVRTASLKD